MARRYLNAVFSVLLLAVCIGPAGATQSVARKWNEVLMSAIRTDLARPTVQARNLFHFSIAAYDAWAAYDLVAGPYLLGHRVGNYTCPFNGVAPPVDISAARDEAISFACYRLLSHRFQDSPGAPASLARFDSLLASMGYEKSFTSTDYSTGSPAALGNYIGQSIIACGLVDGSNETNNYANQRYFSVNLPLVVAQPGNPTLLDPNRWQPLSLSVYIDQNGNVIPGSTPRFLSAEWGEVTPFALTSADLSTHDRFGYGYKVYDDPGPPPALDTLDAGSPGSQLFKWGYELVSVWSSHLKSADPVMVDVSPASIGNNGPLPRTFAELPAFYRLIEGGDRGPGRPLNPRTGMPYEPQWVPRGDYARVLAEFWADGPTSETPPGHWFTILNYVSDQPSLSKRFEGQGPVLDDLEWDVKAYFTLGGAVHDAAIVAWGAKGWYDTIRPISAIRWMAGRGQSSDVSLPHYSEAGLPLIPGFVELVRPGDPLAGSGNENVDKLKLFAWRGPTLISNPASDTAGVGWILAEKWWPYQRPSFVTPPFAGYISGHSTYSRAAAEVLTRITGDEYFPGGVGTFHAPRNQFLVFEDGPSVDVTLQWATYRDASDQCSLSRIWGGIHPPQDDIPGRLAGERAGIRALALAASYFSSRGPTPTEISVANLEVQPDRIRVTWYASVWPGTSAMVYRRTEQSGWKLIGEVNHDGQGYFRFEDRAVSGGALYGYRIGMTGQDGGTSQSEVWATAASPGLALERVSPNPANGSKLVATFTLPTGAPASLELLDISGRRISRLELGTLGAGRHTAAIATGAHTPPGVYLLQITQGGVVRTERAVILAE